LYPGREAEDPKADETTMGLLKRGHTQQTGGYRIGEALLPGAALRTDREVQVLDAKAVPEAALKNVLRSLTPTDIFRLQPIRLSTRETVGSLTFTSATRSRNSQLCGRMAAGRCLRSASRSLLELL
jgi:hypothetical protein